MNKFAEYRDQRAGLLLQGNTNTYQTVEHVLRNMLVIASKVRIVPYSRHPRTVCLRVELKGCLYTGNFYNLLYHESGLRSALDQAQPEQALQVDSWNEKTFLGAAVGILVTVVVAALAAVILVLVRNRSQRKSLSDMSKYNSTDSSSSIEEEYQSTMGSQGRFARLEHQDMAVVRTKNWEDTYSESSKNYTSPSELRFGLRSPCQEGGKESDEDDLSLTMFSIKEESQEDNQSELSRAELDVVKAATRCSTPYNSDRRQEPDAGQDSVKSKKFVLGQLSFSAPMKSAVVKNNKKSRPALGMMVQQPPNYE